MRLSMTVVNLCSAKTTTSTSTSKTITGLKADTGYQVKVRAKDNEGEWGAWGTESGYLKTAPPNQKPGAPGTPTKTGATRTTLDVKWSAATDRDGEYQFV